MAGLPRPVALVALSLLSACPPTRSEDDDASSAPRSPAFFADGPFYENAWSRMLLAVDGDYSCDDVTGTGPWQGLPGRWIDLTLYLYGDIGWEGEYQSRGGACNFYEYDSVRCFDWIERQDGEYLGGGYEPGGEDDVLEIESFGAEILGTLHRDAGDLAFSAPDCGDLKPPYVEGRSDAADGRSPPRTTQGRSWSIRFR
jgi:hypothetical protein